jgi:hypothetical protein
MKLVTRFYRKWLADFWKPRIEYDPLEEHYALLCDAHKMDDKRLDDLLLQRRKLRDSKKKFTHLDGEIVELRRRQLERGQL